MNIPMHQGGPVGMPQMVATSMSQMSSVPPGQHPLHQSGTMQTQEKIDNISKVKSLVGPLRESLSTVLKSAAHTLHQNNQIDTSKGVDTPDQRFNKNMEEFYSVCNELELNLKTAMECLSQQSSSMRYMPIPLANPRVMDNNTQPDPQTYAQFLLTTRSQIQYAREIHSTLVNAAHAISRNE